MTLNLKLLKQQPDINSFSCGNSTIDEHIKEAAYIVALRRCVAYQIFCDNILVGFFSYFILPYPKEAIDLDIEEYQCSYEAYLYDHFCAAYIEYIAVDQKYQRQGIGTAVLSWILTYVRDCLPVRYILIQSTPANLQWYERMGFIKTGETNQNYSENVFLARDLRSNEVLEDMVEQLT